MNEKPNRGGRPRAAEPSETVCTWLTISEHDRLIALAKQQRCSVAAVVREAVRASMKATTSTGA
jgi:DNA gyrase inhibitor GyrI